jgi:hypothetical protein
MVTDRGKLREDRAQFQPAQFDSDPLDGRRLATA